VKRRDEDVQRIGDSRMIAVAARLTAITDSRSSGSAERKDEHHGER